MKKKRKTYQIQQKLEVIDFKKNNPAVTQEKLAQRFNMPIGVINSTLTKMQLYGSRRHKQKKNITFKSCTDKIYEPLYAWIQNKRFCNHTITNEMVREMALKIAQRFYIENFKASHPWISRFKEEYKIKTLTISGEEQLVDPVLLIDSYERFAAMLKKYGSKNFYNCDETALFFKCTPKKH
ncbi:tigger transposable element-derived protein 6-like [Octopus sinensis]|uniref:Tigger transposable element-derived protein 6-like n=1 Tax=Octopus sinensis TaxID=2607531 RepID=A0A6P7U623_9MOLL|nr:tigger transposable element-derived protein 6-like [Octopus sinensis]